jgi:hypothetical protein
VAKLFEKLERTLSEKGENQKQEKNNPPKVNAVETRNLRMAGKSNRLAVCGLRGKVRAHQHADAERRDDPAKLNIALNRGGKR